MKNNPNLRIILAVAFSFVFIAVYSHYFAAPTASTNVLHTQKEISANATQNQAPQIASNTSILQNKTVNKGGDDSAIISRVESKDFEVDIDALGRISQVYLKDKKYTNATELGFFDHVKILLGMMKKPEPKDKLALFQNDGLHPLELRFQDDTINQEAFSTPYTASNANITLGKDSQTLVLTQKLKNITVKKTITFYSDFKYDLKIEMSDPSLSYFISNGVHPLTDHENYAFNGVILEKTDEKIEKIEDGDAKQIQSFENAVFVASVDRYYTSLFFAPNQKPISVVVDASDLKKPIPYIHTQGNLDLGGYIGPKDHAILASINKQLTHVIEYGIITFFAKPVFLLLDFLHSHIGNWGWSIIVLTIIVKLILYPLSYKGMVSMQKIKEIAPMMKELQAKYKNDPQKLQMHTMQLYKKHGANPLGGCLPLIIQIPIFYAIYRVLYNSVELKSANFILWIHDLSVMDPYFVLPILMGVSMYIQQRLTPSGFNDPMQERIFKTLPLFFTIFLIFFPAGLVLYWTVNNILTILQQLSINAMLKRKKQRIIQEHKGTNGKANADV